jgi:simple sugar transport system ATP-binding protein
VTKETLVREPVATTGTFALDEIVKRFGETLALDRVSLTIARGEKVALLGENGAGKSTLMKILYGFYRADSGTIALDGTRVAIASPSDARARGIFMVMQEFSLLPELTILENLLLFHPAIKRASKLLSRKSARLLPPESLATLRSLLPGVDFRKRVRELDVGSVQLLEIAKAVMCQPRLLILDEPSSVLGEHELERLWAYLDSLAAQGVSVVLITHKIKDVKACANRIVVMRKGRLAAEFPQSVSERELLAEMLQAGPAEPLSAAPLAKANDTATRYEIARATYGKWHDFSVEVRRGEMFGIAGISGSGQVELGQMISGAVQLEHGTVLIDGRCVSETYTGVYPEVGYVPQNPRENAIASALTVADNLVLRDLAALPAIFDLKTIPARVPEPVRAEVAKLGIQPPRLDIRAGGLSGGNVQKLAVARELSFAHKVMVVVYPTMGLDIGTQARVLGLLRDEARKGVSVIVVHEEIDQLVAMCDRIMVVAHYKAVATVESSSVTPHAILAMMSGSGEAA